MPDKYLLDTLKEEGKRLKIPESKPRALIREYLQTKIIYYLYQEKSSNLLSFMGGTSLRLLRDLDRFSEDLDFDNLGLKFSKIKNIFSKAKNKLEKEGFEIEYKMKKTDNSGIGEMKFKNLLFQLGISHHKEENLIIRINYTTPKIKPETEILILSRFGMVQSTITNTPEFLLSQKILALFKRKDFQPRDLYDVVWFFSHRIKPSLALFSEIKVKNEKELFAKLKDFYLKRVKPNLKNFKKRLAPFLIDEKKVYYLDIFEDLISKK
ncbi:MAG: nucleotidyl transferase AbiEii/AbiGii toxin family protein [Minisyncoccia bacterium]